jgi:hypothetical protein
MSPKERSVFIDRQMSKFNGCSVRLVNAPTNDLHIHNAVKKFHVPKYSVNQKNEKTYELSL